IAPQDASSAIRLEKFIHASSQTFSYVLKTPRSEKSVSKETAQLSLSRCIFGGTPSEESEENLQALNVLVCLPFTGAKR
ncbi:MAG: hypothetical protein JWO53_566, partial [Chlamydiia bacterium]|nr:hypothetical protein [Chlamydiia bacterium]